MLLRRRWISNGHKYNTLRPDTGLIHFLAVTLPGFGKMDVCANDASFGPGAQCRGLDFTAYFEHAYVFSFHLSLVVNLTRWDRILSITPDAIFLGLCFARIWYLVRQPIVLARAGYFHFGVKCLAGGLVTTTLVVTTGLLSTRDTGLPHVTVVSAGLSLASSVSPLSLLLLYLTY